MQKRLAVLERLPDLYHDCYDLLKMADQEALLATMCGVLIEACNKVKARLERNEQPDFSEFKQIIADMTADKFSEIDDLGQHDKRELLEELKNKFITNCQKLRKEVETVRTNFMRKHGA
jgi:hypothetical protein